MDFEQVEKMATLMEKYGLTKMELREGNSKVILSKEYNGAVSSVPVMQNVVQSSAEANALQEHTSDTPAPIGEELVSPLVGVMYVATGPGEPPFVNVGDQVKKGQTLCIIESMKVMNEFPAPRDGEIVEILVEDNTMVEFGQLLFRLK